MALHTLELGGPRSWFLWHSPPGQRRWWFEAIREHLLGWRRPPRWARLPAAPERPRPRRCERGRLLAVPGTGDPAAVAALLPAGPEGGGCDPQGGGEALRASQQVCSGECWRLAGGLTPSSRPLTALWSEEAEPGLGAGVPGVPALRLSLGRAILDFVILRCPLLCFPPVP